VPVACAYLTDGQARRARTAERNAESRRVLARLGVAAHDIAFPGQALGIADGCLPLRLSSAHAWLGEWLERHAAPAGLHIPAWEGGHQDHDALHAVALEQAAARGLLASTWQYPLYHGAGWPGALPRVLAPLPANGAPRVRLIPWRDRWRNLRCCLAYPSQRSTWALLFGPVMWHYLVQGTESLQPVCLARTHQRPHAGALYYERRRFFSWPHMQAALAHWRAALPSR
jgi:hypothetical protein